MTALPRSHAATGAASADCRIAFEHPTGIALVHAAPGTDIDELAERLVSEGHVPAGAQVVHATDVPGKLFRNAWSLSGDPAAPLSVDMSKARTLHLDAMRLARTPLLVALDVAKMKADETGDAEGVAQAVEKKAALRAVTKTDLSSASTPQDLAAIWPTILAG